MTCVFSGSFTSLGPAASQIESVNPGEVEVQVESGKVTDAPDTEMAELGQASEEQKNGGKNVRLSVPDTVGNNAEEEAGPPGLIDERPKESISIATPSQLPRSSAAQV